MRNLWGSVFPWYFGGGVARQWEGHGASCKWLVNGLLGRCGRVVAEVVEVVGSGGCC
jgi:hypothetical protein